MIRCHHDSPKKRLLLRFSRQHEGELRYVAGWGRWMCWDRMRWREDDTLAVFDRCRAICRRASAECGDAKERAAMKIAAAQTVAAIERLARADRRHAATVEQWDADPWLLNTPTGTVDLRTGELHEPSARAISHQDNGGRSWRGLPVFCDASLTASPMAIPNYRRSCSGSSGTV